MRGERGLLRAGEFLVGFAVRWMPARVRGEWYREWAAELPAILADPSLGPGWRRAARMLGYALDTIRAAALRGQGRYHGAHRGHDPRARVKTARWLLLLPAALAALLVAVVAVLVPPLLLIYLTSWVLGLGLWPAAGVTFMLVVISVLADRFLPRRAFAACTLLCACWLVFLLAASPFWWPAGVPAWVRISACCPGMLAWRYPLDLIASAIRRHRLHPRKN